MASNPMSSRQAMAVLDGLPQAVDQLNRVDKRALAGLVRETLAALEALPRGAGADGPSTQPVAGANGHKAVARIRSLLRAG